jgi:hypothetical protein
MGCSTKESYDEWVKKFSGNAEMDRPIVKLREMILKLALTKQDEFYGLYSNGTR